MMDKDHHHLLEEKREPVSNRGPFAYQANALPLGHTGSHRVVVSLIQPFTLPMDN